MAVPANLRLADGIKLYRELSQHVRKEGILDRAYGYYATLALIIFSAFFFSLYQLITTTNPGHLIFWSFVFGFFATQISGFLHDAGHRAIFASTRMNDIIGFIAGGILATDFASWKYRHNTHHAHPNEEDVDPDIVGWLVISFTKKHFLSKKGLSRIFAPYQAYFYYPTMLLYNFGLRLYGIGYYKKKNLFKPKIILQVLLYGLGIFVWFVLPFIIFPLGKAILVFAVVNIIMSAYLMNIIAPNHKAMPKFAKGIKLSFLDQQILTSSNVYGNWLNDFFYMGLNYQIEHHLFPNCPRNKLSKIAPFVREICRKRRLAYTEVGFIQSNKNILAELNRVARSE